MFHKSTHSNGSGQKAFAHGLFDVQNLSIFLAIVACPYCVPFTYGGKGKLLPSNLNYFDLLLNCFPTKI